MNIIFFFGGGGGGGGPKQLLQCTLCTVNRGYLRQNWDIFRNRKILSSISRTVICDSRDGMYGQIVTQG